MAKSETGLGIRGRSLGTRVGVAWCFMIAGAVGLNGCTFLGSGLPPTGSPGPSPSAGTSLPDSSSTGTATPVSEWGGYGGRDEACFGVAGDLVALALVPANLALVGGSGAGAGSSGTDSGDSGTPESGGAAGGGPGGVDGIDDTIQTMVAVAPRAVRANYLQLSALVLSYGRELDAYEAAAAAAAAASAAPTGTAPTGTAPTGNPSGTATPGAPAGSPTPSASPTRPAFDSGPFDTQVDSIRSWLETTCVG